MTDLVSSQRAFNAVASYLRRVYDFDDLSGEMSEDLDALLLEIDSAQGGLAEWEDCLYRELNDDRTPPALSDRPLHVPQMLNAKQGFDTMRRFFQLHAELCPEVGFYDRLRRDAAYETCDTAGDPNSPMWQIWLHALDSNA